jgi:hypothetical protein
MKKIPNYYRVKPLIYQKEEEELDRIVKKNPIKPVSAPKPKKRKKHYNIVTHFKGDRYYSIDAYDKDDALNRFDNGEADVYDEDYDDEEILEITEERNPCG